MYVVFFHGVPGLRAHFEVPTTIQTFFGYGYLAVGFFFLLSGFILVYTYEGQMEGATNRGRFWEARFTRIYPVYLLSLALAYWFQPNLHVGTAAAVLSMVQAWNPGAPELAGAWNYPAWSLSVEAFFYLCFPFLLPWLSRRSTSILRCVVVVLLAVCVAGHTCLMGLGNWNHSSAVGRVLPLPVLRLPEFLLGMALGLLFLRSGGKSHHPLWTYGALLSLLGLLSLPLGEWISLVMVPFAVLIYELARGESRLSKALSTPLMVLLGGASYAIYLLQLPVRDWTRAALSSAPTKVAEIGALGTPLILVLFSVLVFEYWEEPLRRALRRWLAGGKRHLLKLRSSAVLARDG